MQRHTQEGVLLRGENTGSWSLSVCSSTNLLPLPFRTWSSSLCALDLGSMVKLWEMSSVESPEDLKSKTDAYIPHQLLQVFLKAPPKQVGKPVMTDGRGGAGSRLTSPATAVLSLHRMEAFLWLSARVETELTISPAFTTPLPACQTSLCAELTTNAKPLTAPLGHSPAWRLRVSRASGRDLCRHSSSEPCALTSSEDTSTLY